VVISARPLNVRAAPNPNGGIITTLASCSTPLLTGSRSPDGLWIEVLTPTGNIGWVLGEYLLTVEESGSGGVG
jgi:hypothetical protein